MLFITRFSPIEQQPHADDYKPFRSRPPESVAPFGRQRDWLPSRSLGHALILISAWTGRRSCLALA